MKRRDFVRRAVAGAGAASVMGALPGGFEETGRWFTHAAADGYAEPSPPAEPAPISESEYAERRAKAQRLMAELHIQALFIEPGANLLYFSGIRWGRSERLFGMLLPRAGAPVFVVPAFETARAAAQIRDRFEIRSWEEDRS